MQEKKRGWRILVFSGVALILIVCALFSLVSAHPSFGAQGADFLRNILGDRVVASLELVLFQIQDQVNHAKYALGWSPPTSPWGDNPALPSPGLVTTRTLNSSPVKLSIPSMQPGGPAPERSPSASPFTSTPQRLSTAILSPIISPTPSSPPTITPTQEPLFPPAALSPLGSRPGEGVWSEYLFNPAGQIVAYRTYLQPDPKRPYAVIAVVAIDLTRTRLHYVLGFEEPYNPQGPKRKGAIPDSDKIPGILLATFNGGFKAIHGHFGAMSDGIVALPPRNGLGTIAIYNNGQVQMGVWGEDLVDSPDLVAYRQNGPPVVYKGEINPQIQSNDPMEWGYTVDKVAPTWRSGMGLSRDGNILYYFCGSSLSMEALSTAMLHSGAYTAIQLDINGYWVMFVATIPDGDSFILKPLFPLQMTEFIDRYMHPYGRDFFYLTTK